MSAEHRQVVSDANCKQVIGPRVALALSDIQPYIRVNYAFMGVPTYQLRLSTIRKSYPTDSLALFILYCYRFGFVRIVSGVGDTLEPMSTRGSGN